MWDEAFGVFYHICGLWSQTSSHSATVCGPQSNGHWPSSPPFRWFICFFSEGDLFLGLGCVCSDCITRRVTMQQGATLWLQRITCTEFWGLWGGKHVASLNCNYISGELCILLWHKNKLGQCLYWIFLSAWIHRSKTFQEPVIMLWRKQVLVISPKTDG